MVPTRASLGLTWTLTFHIRDEDRHDRCGGSDINLSNLSLKVEKRRLRYSRNFRSHPPWWILDRKTLERVNKEERQLNLCSEHFGRKAMEGCFIRPVEGNSLGHLVLAV